MNARRAAALLTIATVAAGAAGCGSESGPASTTNDTARTTTDPQQQLETAVREAIRRDHEESVRSLWTNRVPAEPAASAGPALKQWRRSVADRRRAGVRVRSLYQRVRILDVKLDPSYETATALIRADQRVQPVRRDGRRIGKQVAVHQRVRIVLHRAPGDRWVVWDVEVLER